MILSSTLNILHWLWPTAAHSLCIETQHIFSPSPDSSSEELFIPVPEEQSTHHHLFPDPNFLPITKTTTVLTSIVMAATIPMPACGQATTLRFDPVQPHELQRYFSDLNILFAASQGSGGCLLFHSSSSFPPCRLPSCHHCTPAVSPHIVVVWDGWCGTVTWRCWRGFTWWHGGAGVCRSLLMTIL
jgi:hypothetical protein